MHPTLSAFAPFSGVPGVLLADKDPGASSLLADMPFIGLASIGIAMLLFLVTTRRLTRSSGVLILSIHTAFLGAIMDIANVIVQANTTSVSRMFPLIVAREVFLAISHASKFFYVWLLSGQSIAALIYGGNSFPASWARWGLGGTVANGTLLVLSAGIGLTQLIWRAGFLFQLTNYLVLYDLDTILEIATTGLLLAKLTLNIWFSPPFTPMKAAKAYAPLVFATLLGLSGPIGNLLGFMWSDTPYGRLLEAIQLYLYALYALVLSFYASVKKESSRKTEKSPTQQRRPSALTIPSFRDISEPPSATLPYSYPSPAPLMQTYAEPVAYARPDAKRWSTTERLSQWVSERAVLSPTGAGKAWIDLERGHKRERSSMDQTIRAPVRAVAPSSDKRHIRDNAPSRKTTLDSQTSGPARKPSTSSQGGGASVTVVSPTNGDRMTLSRSNSSKNRSPIATETTGSNANRDSALPSAPRGIIGGTNGTRTKPSVLGRPTISRIQSISSMRSPSPSTDLSVALREQDERDRTVAEILQARDSMPSQYALSPHSNSYRSGTSSVSLSNFPSPPPMPMPVASSSKQIVPKPLQLPNLSITQQSDRKGKSRKKSEDIIVDDVLFTLAPPNWKRNIDKKGDSYASAASSTVMKRDQYDSSAQWDITSFIGGVVSPGAESAYSPSLLSAGPPGRREYSAPYPSAVASSALLSPAQSVMESEDNAQILEVKHTHPIMRIMPTLPEKAIAMKAKEKSPSRGGSLDTADKTVENPVSILPDTRSSSGSPSREGSPQLMPAKAAGPGKTSPFPTRPLAGLGSLSTQIRAGSPGGAEMLEASSTAFEKPRPAPSPVSTTTSPVSRPTQPPSGFI
ncbi:hypothetical protein DACRYDRAFT_107566 [Dacryopinax primogenitus]|uniref:Uncharacterized protein n=1 Tax=Dacryopinax primogenitus (strain DJM 731) TaxID=1858805 RepID=M5G7I2_DACPD|nr:uncharacterized protein DACRYDRAFT_107566 [Dacryopinax primogenitus]EJU01832.1 hypothetical protein DACRYDRAFT_107566 [Dacryopinax primogenitus]